MEISVIGIDLAKGSFAVCEMSKTGKVLARKEMSRKKLIEYSAKIKSTLIGFEACGGSHYWARLFSRQGHRVKMMSVARVKAFTPPQKKNDRADAEAIALAALSDGVPSVRIKGVDQQDIEIQMNLREQLIRSRVALTNQAHAVALEYGVQLPKAKSPALLERTLAELEDAENLLTLRARETIAIILSEAKRLGEMVDEIKFRLEAQMKANENYQRLTTIPGVGPLTAVAVLAHTGGDVSSFKNGRQFAAYLGLVPRQVSTGGRTKLIGVTKSGEQNIRRLLVVGTNSVLIYAKRKDDHVSKWAEKKKQTLGYRKATVALANKMARIIYCVLKNQESYRLAS